MKSRRKLFSNTFYLFLDWFTLNLTGFLYWFIAGKILLPHEYGIISTSVNLAVLLSSISFLGLNLTMRKIIPEYLAKKKVGKIRTFLKTSLKTLTYSYFILLIVFLLFSKSLSVTIKLPTNVILISLLLTFSFLFSGFFGGILYGFQEMRKFFLSDFYGQLVKVIIATLLIFLGFRYYGSLIGILVGFFLILLIRSKMVIRLLNFFKPGEKIEFRKIMKDYSLPAFISFLATTLFLNGQYVLLTILKDTEVTGIFSIAMLLTSIIATFPGILSSALFPIISFLSADSRTKSKQRYLIQLVLRYAFFFSLPIAFLLSIFSKQAILFFSRVEYLEASSLFPILITASLIFGMRNIFLSNLYAIGKTKIYSNIILLTTFIFFILVFPLVNKFSSLGIAISYLLSVLVSAILGYFYLEKSLLFKVPLIPISKAVLSSSLSFLLLYYLTRFTSGITDYLLVLFSGAVYLIVLYFMKFYRKEDVRILEIGMEKISFLKPFLKPVITILSKNLEGVKK